MVFAKLLIDDSGSNDHPDLPGQEKVINDVSSKGSRVRSYSSWIGLQITREVAKIMDSEINETSVYNLNGHLRCYFRRVIEQR